jgi:hypothetical protein
LLHPLAPNLHQIHPPISAVTPGGGWYVFGALYAPGFSDGVGGLVTMSGARSFRVPPEPTEGWLRRGDDEVRVVRAALFSRLEVRANDFRLFHDPGSGSFGVHSQLHDPGSGSFWVEFIQRSYSLNAQKCVCWLGKGSNPAILAPPMTAHTFFTAWSEPALPGSRDPLGFISVWSDVGTGLIPHVKTTASDLDGWLTLLLSVAIAGHALQHDLDRGTVPNVGFIHRVEKIIGYARGSNPNAKINIWAGLRGQGEMKKWVKQPKIPLHEPVLINPPAAGVWGQISGSAEVARLLDKDFRRLCVTPESLFDTAWDRVLTALAHPSSKQLLGTEPVAYLEPGGKHARLVQAIRDCFPSDEGRPLASAVRQGLDKRLLGGESSYAALANFLRAPDGTAFAGWSRGGLTRSLLGSAVDVVAPQHPILAEQLTQILRVSSVLGRSELAFSILTHDSLRRGTVSEVDGYLSDMIDSRAMPADWEAGFHSRVEPHDRRELSVLGRAWASGQPAAVRQALLLRHECVMRRRKHQPWVRIIGSHWSVLRAGSTREDASGATAKVVDRLRHDDLVHPYYLSAFASLAHALGARQDALT